MKRPPPLCKATFTWVRNRLGRDSLAPCTGQDYRALAAWFHLVELWGVSDYAGRDAAELAMAAVLDGMQQSVWPIAKASIPGVLDWSHEDQIWSAVNTLRNDATLAARRVRAASGLDATLEALQRGERAR